MPQISFNGKTYKSVDEMPPDARKAYEKAMSLLADANHDGVPDALEGLTSNTSIQYSTIVYEGKSYNSADDLPPEARAKYEAAMAKIDADRNGIPDVLEGRSGSVQIESPRVSVNTTTIAPNISRRVVPAARSVSLILIGIALIAMFVGIIAVLVVMLLLK